MNPIVKNPLHKLGYDFIPKPYLPEGMDEYYIRNEQAGDRSYRSLNAREIEILVRNNNTSDDWNRILVDEAFDPDLVKNCQFHGLVRIGKLEPYYLEFHNLRVAVGLYNSTICSCDFGDNVGVHQVNYLSHYIIGNEVILTNVEEMATTDYSKFGNGILKDGEEENHRIWLEICNENGGRSVLPFEGMLPADAYLWSRFREDEVLMGKFRSFTQQRFDSRRGYYGSVGDRTVIKNCKIIKDTRIGTEAYLKGANKIKNLTLNSRPEERSQIGEGCELVNGIIGFGCRVFYGVKAVRFVMASHSSLKYGARLINSYLGNNATVSCCEVLNSLIFPAHEQHHNNSFLCAALLMGQSNMAAGATIGSNHNSRGADGEIIAGRGFWPGLCVSLKHNSRFAPFALIAKGNYPAEINLEIPFSLLVHEEYENCLKVMPGYWFLYNMYALARNCWKYRDRDHRSDPNQLLEYDYLAPDSVEQMFRGMEIMELAAGQALYRSRGSDPKQEDPSVVRAEGRSSLQTKPEVLSGLTLYYEGLENSKRKNVLLKVPLAYPMFCDLIFLYGMESTLNLLLGHPRGGWEELIRSLQQASRESWTNMGGQLIPDSQLQATLKDIRTGELGDWEGLHRQYLDWSTQYPRQRSLHSLACLLEIRGITAAGLTPGILETWLEEVLGIRERINQLIFRSREKDYRNPFRNMVYDNAEQRDRVVGKLEQNGFILQTEKELEGFRGKVRQAKSILAQLVSGSRAMKPERVSSSTQKKDSMPE